MSMKLPFYHSDLGAKSERDMAVTDVFIKLSTIGVISLIITVVVATVLLLNPSKPSTFTQVKSGELTLYCLFQDGERAVDPDLVTEHWHEYGYWKFTNGGAGNCRTE